MCYKATSLVLLPPLPHLSDHFLAFRERDGCAVNQMERIKMVYPRIFKNPLLHLTPKVAILLPRFTSLVQPMEKSLHHPKESENAPCIFPPSAEHQSRHYDDEETEGRARGEESTLASLPLLLIHSYVMQASERGGWQAIDRLAPFSESKRRSYAQYSVQQGKRGSWRERGECSLNHGARKSKNFSKLIQITIGLEALWI